MMKTYIVTAKPKRPAYGDHGHQLTITAATKAKAISKARSEVRREMHYDRHDGPIEYTATEAGNEP